MKNKPTIFFFIALTLNCAFTLSAQVTANFSFTPSTGCAPLSVNFTDLSTGSPSAWSWNFGNGNTSALQNPSAIYSTPGTYTITLVCSKTGSTSSKTATITIAGKPVADFTTSSLPSCVGQTITFTDNSSGGATIASWSWDFGDGNTQTTTTNAIAHTYTSGGTFPVSVIVTDSNGCSGSIIKSVTVLSAPVPAFTATPLSSCTAPLTVNFTNTSTTTGTVSYLWNFGDGTPNSTAANPVHTYSSLGSYTVKLIVTQGACIDSIVKTNYIVLQNIHADFSADTTSACVGNTITFTDLSFPLSASRTWDFGDGSPVTTVANPTHTYTSAGTYTVSLLNASANGCSDSEIKTSYITIHPLPVANFSSNITQGCELPLAVNFTDNSTNATGWLWDFGDGTATSSLQNPAHNYTSEGTFTVRLIVTSANGCVDTIVKPNYIIVSRPKAIFSATPRQGCIPLTVNFTDISSSLLDPIVSYDWDFGNGTATTASPAISQVYSLPGMYNVTLIVTTASGCKDTVTYNKYVRAGNTPVANFTIVDSVVCYGEISQFNDLSSANADSAFWQFGDGGQLPTLLPNPLVSYQYPLPGTYTVTLIVFNNGCSDTLIQPNIVTILSPKPVFSYQLNCINPYSVDFTDASIDADSITWDLGDGTPLISDSLTLTHLYATRGLKTVTLTAWNFTTGCSFFMTSSFTIAEPIAQFTSGPAIGCYPLPVLFTNTSQDAFDSVTWKLGDGSRDTLRPFTSTLSHTYLLPGSYPVKLIITDVNNCTDSIVQNVIVQGALPDFTADTLTGCKPLLINFNDNSVSDSTLVQWKWSFGDASAPLTVTSPSVNHTYTSTGFYSVKMVVTDKNGCSDSITKTNYIEVTYPTPAFVADTFACRGEMITFNASTSIATGPGVVYTWDFGDGSAAGNGVTTSHAYTADSLYTVTLTVTDKNGCDSIIQHQVRVEHPVADFKDSTYKEDCSFRDIQFTDLSTGTAITGWQWNFGDGATSTSKNPRHVYTVPGLYTVSLIVTNMAGCADTITYPNLIVVPGPIGSFTFSPTTGCNPLTVTFTATSNNATEYIWDFGDGSPLVTTTDSIITHTYLKDITANPQLLLANVLNNGNPCRLPATNLTGTIVVTTVIGVDVHADIVTVKEGDFFVINSTITNITGNPTYTWTPSYNLSCIDCETPSVKGNSGGGDTLTYYFAVTDQNGCIGYDSIKVFFVPCEEDLFIPNVFTPNGDGTNETFDIQGICERDKYQLTIYDRWGVPLFWSDTKKLSWDGRTKSGEEAPDGIYYYIITHKEKTYKGFLHLIR